MSRRKSSSKLPRNVVVYVDKNGTGIAPTQWTKLYNDEEYRTIRKFDNGKVGVVLTWLGRERNARVAPKEYWKIFKLSGYTHLVVGNRPGEFTRKKVDDPTVEKYFPTLEKAIAGYESHLINRGLAEIEVDSYTDEENFAEKGNIFNTPKSEGSAIQIKISSDKPNVGSW